MADNIQPQQPKEQKKKSIFSLGMGKKEEEEKPPQLTETKVAGKATTLVGNTVESRQPGREEVKTPTIPEQVLFEWQAPEFVYTKKPIGWYIGVLLFFLILIGLAIWLQQWITIALLAVMALTLVVWANRQPRNLKYTITNYGVTVDNKKYLFDDFRAYYEFSDYNQQTIDLVPGKRFGTLVSLPLATTDADEIEATIGRMVPKIEHNQDIIDRISRSLRF